MTTGEQRPGDAARRALRAARERAESERDGGTPDTPETRTPVPADAGDASAPGSPTRAHRPEPDTGEAPKRAYRPAPDTAGTPSEDTPTAEHRPAEQDRSAAQDRSAEAPRPGDIARAALRAAVAAARSTGRGGDAAAAADVRPAGGAEHAGAAEVAEAPEVTGGAGATGVAGTEPAPGESPAGGAPAGEPVRGEASAAGTRSAAGEPGDTAEGLAVGDVSQPDTERAPADGAVGPAPESAPTAPPAEARPAEGRPGDAARQALRAARSEALRAGPAPGMPRGGRTRARAAGSAARTTPGPERPGGESGTVRAEAAREMRRFLTDAFRMPSWGDTAEETDDTVTPASDTHHTTAHDADLAADAPAPARGDHPPADPDPAGAAAPRVPTTMATPHRDSELRRTFPASGPGPGSRGAPDPAETWWGNAWIDALERGALDPKRLARGRGYAEQGNVDAITVTPGTVLAYVRGSRPRPYRVQVRLRTLEDDDWERFLDAAADRPGHIAALLDKELPQSLADCGVPLLPGPGDLAPHCSCPDSGHPCKHAAALCYRTARLLDADPFVLLLLRGRGERELLDALSRRSAARAARAAREGSPRSLPGVRATDALAPGGRPPLPAPLPPVPHPEQPPVYPAAPGGPDPFALDQLATDAAARAHALLATGRDPVGELTLWEDAVRLAAARPGSGLTATSRALYATLAQATGRTPADLARAVAAWRQGGLEGLAVLDEPWDPPAGRFDRARPLLLAADLPAFRPWRNRLTHPHGRVQLRLGRDGLWYAYESEPGQDDWWPRGTPDPDPVGALTGLGTPDDL
ncbi:SWIM zinc finger family protein [Streptomyces collinus]